MPSILVVDDDPSIALLFSEYLRQATEYEIRTAADGEIALEEILRERPTLVVTDIYMPKMDGFSLIERLDQMHIHLPIIIVSGKGTKEDEDRARGLGVENVLEKPVHLERLKDIIELTIRQISPEEVRDRTRIPAKLKVRRVQMQGQTKTTFETETVNLSTGGICFKWYFQYGDLFDRPVPGGEDHDQGEAPLLELELADSGGSGSPLLLKTRAIHRVSLPDRDFDYVGAEFIDLSEEDARQLQVLIDSTQPS